MNSNKYGKSRDLSSEWSDWMLDSRGNYYQQRIGPDGIRQIYYNPADQNTGTQAPGQYIQSGSVSTPQMVLNTDTVSMNSYSAPIAKSNIYSTPNFVVTPAQQSQHIPQTQYAGGRNTSYANNSSYTSQAGTPSSQAWSPNNPRGFENSPRGNDFSGRYTYTRGNISYGEGVSLEGNNFPEGDPFSRSARSESQSSMFFYLLRLLRYSTQTLIAILRFS